MVMLNCILLYGLCSIYVDLSSAEPVTTSYDTSPQYRLYNNLFEGYNTKLRPRYNPNDTINVGIEFEINTVTGLDEVNQVMNTVGFIVAVWYDEYLVWNEREFDTDHLVLPAQSIWLPDMGVKNSAGTFYDITYTRDFRVDIRYDGRVLWAFGGNFATSCTLDMTYYPFDLQTCEIDIENWSYTRDAVDLYNLKDKVKKQDYTENGEWQLEDSTAKFEEFEEDTHVGKTFPRVKFRMFLTRKFSYYLINIICPALFVIAISLTVFWLPPESGEKVSLGITVLLAFSVFQLVIMENTPRTSDFTPVMTMLFTIIMGMSTFSVLTSIAVLYFHHHGAERRAPQIVRFIAFKIIARALCMQQHVPDENQIVPKLEEQKKMTPEEEVVDLDFANFKAPMPTGNSTNGSGARVGVGIGMNAVPQSPIPGSPKKHHSEREYIKEILQHLRGLTSRILEKERDDVIIEEWRSISKVMDRMFFWIAFIIVGITVPVLLLRKDDKH